MNQKVDWESLKVGEINIKLESMKEYKHLLTKEFKKLKKEEKLQIIEKFEQEFENKLNALINGIFYLIKI
jgi:hypothetical protein